MLPVKIIRHGKLWVVEMDDRSSIVMGPIRKIFSRQQFKRKYFLQNAALPELNCSKDEWHTAVAKAIVAGQAHR
jgi:hypothetical protein